MREMMKIMFLAVVFVFSAGCASQNSYRNPRGYDYPGGPYFMPISGSPAPVKCHDYHGYFVGKVYHASFYDDGLHRRRDVVTDPPRPGVIICGTFQGDPGGATVRPTNR